MFHTTTSEVAGRLRNMASATDSFKSDRMDGWKEEAEDDKEVSQVYLRIVHVSVYVYIICMPLNI